MDQKQNGTIVSLNESNDVAYMDADHQLAQGGLPRCLANPLGPLATRFRCWAQFLVSNNVSTLIHNEDHHPDPLPMMANPSSKYFMNEQRSRWSNPNIGCNETAKPKPLKTISKFRWGIINGSAWKSLVVPKRELKPHRFPALCGPCNRPRTLEAKHFPVAANRWAHLSRTSASAISMGILFSNRRRMS